MARKPRGGLKSIAVMQQKGGVGKTTIAVHLSVAAQAAGEKTVLIDADHPQASATVWSDRRPEGAEPPVITVEPIDVPAVVEAAAGDGRTFAVIDTSPHATPSAAAAAGVADFILIPVLPSLLDLAASQRAAAIATAAQDKARKDGRKPPKAAFVINGAPPRDDDVELRDTAAALQAWLPLAPMTIGRRKPFVRALGHGEAVVQFQPRGQAAAEINALYAWIMEQINAR